MFSEEILQKNEKVQQKPLRFGKDYEKKVNRIV